MVPEYRCVLLGEEWWIVDTDAQRGFFQRVATLQLADNPNHNYGIHRAEARGNIYEAKNDSSEFSKVIRENLSPESSFSTVLEDGTEMRL